MVEAAQYVHIATYCCLYSYALIYIPETKVHPIEPFFVIVKFDKYIIYYALNYTCRLYKKKNHNLRFLDLHLCNYYECNYNKYVILRNAPIKIMYKYLLEHRQGPNKKSVIRLDSVN